MRMRESRLGRFVVALRELLGRLPVTSWLIGGEEAAVSHTLRQGLLAALLIMVGSWGVGWLPITPDSLLVTSPLLLPLRTTTSGVVTCTVLLVLGTLLLVRSWLRLSRRVGGWTAEATATVRTAVWMWSAPLLLTLPIISRDVYSYLAQGRVLQSGMNPYETGVSELPGWFMEGADGVWAQSPSPYGPLFLLIARGIWVLSGGVPEIGILCFRLLSLAGVLLMVRVIPRLARAMGSQPAWALWLCLLNPLSLLVLLPAAHNDAPMLGLVLLGLWWCLRRRRLAAVVVLTAAVAIKPIAVVVLPFAMLLTLDRTDSYALRLREWLVAGAVAVVLLLAAGQALGVGLGWVTAALTAGSAITQAAPVGLLGGAVGWVVAEAGGPEADVVASAVHLGFRMLSVLLVAVMLLRPRLGNPVLWAGYAVALVVACSSVIQPWYLLWVLPLVAVVHVHRGRLLMLATLVLTGVVLVSLVGQLSVAQWIDTATVQSIAVLVALAYLAFLVLIDPGTGEHFDLSRPAQRWNLAEGWTSVRAPTIRSRSWSRRELVPDTVPDLGSSSGAGAGAGAGAGTARGSPADGPRDPADRPRPADHPRPEDPR